MLNMSKLNWHSQRCKYKIMPTVVIESNPTRKLITLIVFRLSPFAGYAAKNAANGRTAPQPKSVIIVLCDISIDI